MNTARITNEQETLHEISFAMGFEWNKMPVHVCSHLCDSVQGSRGLADLAVAWATEFDELYAYDQAQDQATLNGIPVDGFLDAVEGFFQARWRAFVAGAVAKRLTG